MVRGTSEAVMAAATLAVREAIEEGWCGDVGSAEPELRVGTLCASMATWEAVNALSGFPTLEQLSKKRYPPNSMLGR